MLTGRTLFEAGDVSEMLASVLVKDPDVSRIGANVPFHVRSVVRQCLVKDPRNRLRDIGDARLALSGQFRAAPDDSELWQRPSPGWRPGLAFGVAGLLVGAVVTYVLVRDSTEPPQAMSARFSLELPAPMVRNEGPMVVEISPDGHTLVYAGRDRLYRRGLDTLEWQPIPGTENGVDPMFSPDGRWLAFEDAEGLKRVPVEGGPAATIIEGPAPIRGADWLPSVSSRPDLPTRSGIRSVR